jgi:hypothetical protein
MKPRELTQQQNVIEEAIRFGTSLDSGSPERAMVARHVCVLAAGYLEDVVRVCLSEFAHRSRPKPELWNYIEASVDRFRNPEFDRILNITSLFNASWREKLSRVDDSIKSAINSVVSNRHLIAHGRTSGISLAQMTGYFEMTKAFAKEYASICR